MTRRRTPKPDLTFAGDCSACGCTETGCEVKRWLGGKACCDGCNHQPTGGTPSHQSRVRPRDSPLAWFPVPGFFLFFGRYWSGIIGRSRRGCVMAVRDAAETLAAAVTESVSALGLSAADRAAGRLASELAQAIDAAPAAERPKLVARIGPSLLRCLEQLGATPRARAEVGTKMDGRRHDSELSRLRAAHRP